MKNTQLISLLEPLSAQFRDILFNMVEGGQAPDGIIKSISATLDKALHNAKNGLPMTQDIKTGMDNSCFAAMRLFEGSVLEDELNEVNDLIDIYENKG